MVLTSRTRTAFFVPTATTTTTRPETLIRLPLSVVPKYETTDEVQRRPAKPLLRTNLWSSEEHERFLHGLELFPTGPWREVAAIVGTKTTRQTMTHAQKYRQKIERRMRAKSPQPKKPRRRTKRKATPTETLAPNVPLQPAAVKKQVDEMSFVSLHTIDFTPAKPAVASPAEIWCDIFDSTFLDQEFDALISSLGPPPPSSHEAALQQYVSWL